ncbi:hypothetical protein LINPERPRIM_LOCUS41282 [Linum perenne]
MLKIFNISLSRVVIVPPNVSEVPPQILTDPKYYPYFKDCVGAINGVHVDAIIPISQQTPFVDGKETPLRMYCVFFLSTCILLMLWRDGSDLHMMLEY